MKICPSCNTANDDLAKFCSNCGTNLKKEEIPKPKKKKLSKGIKTLIGIGAFVLFIAILYLSLFLYVRFYINEKFAFIIGQNNSINVIDKNKFNELSFGDLFTCLSVDKNSLTPTGITKVFNIGTKKIYAAIPVIGLYKGGNFKFIWKYADSGKTIFEDSKDYPASSGIYLESYKFSSRGIPEDKDVKNHKLFGEPGTYKVDFYFNNKFIKSTDFTMIAPKPTFKGQVVGNLINTNTFEPAEVKDSYSSKIEELYSAIKITGYFNENDNFRFVLKKTGLEGIIKEYFGSYKDLTEDKYLDKYLYFYLTGPYSDKDIVLTEGQYTVEFYNNVKLESEKQFTIIPPQATFGEIYLCKSINPDDLSPVDVTDYFILGSRSINACINVENAKSGDNFKFVITNEDKSKILHGYANSYNADEGQYFGGWQAIRLNVPEGSSTKELDVFNTPGLYFVEFYHNDKLVAEKSFEIIDRGAQFGELQFCENVNSNDKPINPKKIFNYGTKLIFASIEVNGVKLDESCKFVWRRKEDGVIIRESSFVYGDNWTKGGEIYNGYFAMGIGLPTDQKLEEHDILGHPGSYEVLFYHEGFLISIANFEIIK